MIAILQERISLWPRYASRDTVPDMVKHADTSETASMVRAQQQQRLARLRQIYDVSQIDAARRAGVSTHTWSRMERGGGDG